MFQLAGEDKSVGLLEQMDSNNDGKVDYSEFLAAAVDHQAMLNKDSLIACFNMIDEN